MISNWMGMFLRTDRIRPGARESILIILQRREQGVRISVQVDEVEDCRYA